MKKKKRTFKEFLVASGIDGIKMVATEYATEDDSVTLCSLSEKYNISLSAIKKIIEYAIVNCIVSYKVALFIKAKAHRNQVRHYKKDTTQTSSDAYYKKLFSKRFDFVKTFDDAKVLKVANCYISNPHLSGISIAESLGLSSQEMNILLKKAIIFCIIDDDTANCLKKVSINKVKFNTSIFVEDIFKQYFELRNFYKFLNSKIAQLHFQLEAYDDFISSDDERKKESIEKDLEETKNCLEKFIKSF